MDADLKNLWRNTWVILTALMLLLLVSGCGAEARESCYNCNVVVESGEDYAVFGNLVSALKGEKFLYPQPDFGYLAGYM